MHGIFTCKYCAQIAATLAMREMYDYGRNGIRSNQLLRLVRDLIDPNMAPPTLYRHLKYLQKGRILKRRKKGAQNIIYYLNPASPLLEEDEFRFHKKLAIEYERFKSFSLKLIVTNLLILARMHTLETARFILKMEMETSSERRTSIKFAKQIMDSFYRQYFMLLYEAMKEKESQYKEVMSFLEQEITDMRDKFLQ